MSIARAAELAFEGRLSAAHSALLRADPSISTPDGVKLAAYLAAARGDFEEAERSARGLFARRALEPDLRAGAAVTLGSVLRQTGRYREARAVERAALRLARRRDVRAHLLIGLAADSVGLGDLREVDAALRRLGAHPAGGWRAGVRLDWVRCERDLLARRPGAGVVRARRALVVSERAGAQRHQAKSLLFLGAALLEAGAERGEAGRALRRARTTAARMGARPIADVAEDLLGRFQARR